MRGATRVHWMIGSPIAQVHMPALASQYFQEHRRDEAVVPIEVPPAQLPAALALFAAAGNVHGLLSTLPHKATLAGCVDRRSERSALLGMVNTVRKDGAQLVGDIFDGEGVVSALHEARVPLNGRQVTVIGCGGLGSAAAYAVLEQRAVAVSLFDAQADRAITLARLLGQRFGEGRAQACDEAPLHTEVLLHCSPVGMDDRDAMPCNLQGLTRLTAVVDGAASTRATALMRAAAARKLSVVGGDAIARAQWRSVIGFWDA